MIAHEISFQKFAKIDLQILNTRKIEPFFWTLLEKQLGKKTYQSFHRGTKS